MRELSVLSLEAQRFAPLENKRIEKKKQTNIILNGWRIKMIFYFLALSYSAQPYIAVHCSNEGKILPLTPLLQHSFLYVMVLKIAF